MTRQDYVGWLVTVSAAVLLAIPMLRAMTGERWFGLYGLAAIVLAAAIVLGAVVWSRLGALGRSRWPVLAVVLPVVLLAGAQIAFWTAFFSAGQGAISLAMLRAVILDNAGPYVPIAIGMIGALVAWMLFSGLGPRAEERRAPWPP